MGTAGLLHEGYSGQHCGMGLVGAKGTRLISITPALRHGGD